MLFRLHFPVCHHAQARSVFQPFSADQACSEADRAAHPVAHHGDPDADRAHAEMNSEQVAGCKADEHHGRNRAQHRVSNIVRGAENVRQSERRRPEHDRAAVMNGDQDKAERERFRRHAVHLEDERRERDGRDTGQSRNHIGDLHQLFRHESALRLVSRADALSDDRDDGKAHRLPRNDRHGIQIVRQRIRGDLRRAEQRDHAHNEHAAKLKQAVFQSVRHADL